MSCVAVIGAQWGDEGKGKIVDFYTEFADLVVRWGGGPNAGHTLVVGEEKVITRLLPSGILNEGTKCVLGQGMVVDLDVLLGEIDGLEKRGRKGIAERLVLSNRAHLVLPYHILVDGLREKTQAIGTTKKGIGPAYEDKVRRTGVRAGDLTDLARVAKKVGEALEQWAPFIVAFGGTVPTVESVMEPLKPLAARVVPLLGDTSLLVAGAIKAGKRVLLEGAQGTLLDVDHGTYPYVTSSSPVSGGAATGIGIGPNRINTVIGITKAYATRVGEGPFPTELFGAAGDALRKAGHEFGSVTGRPRRCGWLDLPALRYAVRVNGLDSFAMTKIDVLCGLKNLALCVAYELDGERLAEPPPDAEDLARVKPIYETLPGWDGDLSEVRTIEELPRSVRAYIDRVERETRCAIKLLSVGADREHTITLGNPFV